jgi:NAD+ synthase (glutamine-hydrolysing)
MKIALAQINPTIGAFDHNCHQIMAQAHAARKAGCNLVVFSELTIPGYPPRDLLDKGQFIDANLASLQGLVAELTGIGVICGYVDRNPDESGNPLLNSAVLFENGRILQTLHKQLLPTYDVFDERRHFEPGPATAPFEFRGLRIGLTICEDMWNDKDVFKKRIYGSDPVIRLARAGAELLINISASVYHVGKHNFRRHMFSTMAKKYGVPLLFCNQVGGNDSVLYDGASSVFMPDGSIAAQARDFAPDLICYDTQRRTGDQHPIAEDDLSSIWGALVMGTRDYLGKCGFNKALVGLSGGIDSALTLCIAVEALGSNRVDAIFMPSDYTSRDNYEDTRQLAQNLGVSYQVIPIGDIFGGFIHQLSPQFDHRRPGVTEQNIQARIRGTILMAHSNRSGALVLATGNKSELAVGYCTLYGDMCGGLAVIGDVPKTMVYRLSQDLNCRARVIPERILAKPPSAELAPDQIDQDDLPPYEVIDPIIKAYVEEARGLEEIVALGFDHQVAREVINRVDKNEYKRFQAPPVLKVTPKAFGEGRRYPLAKRFALK